MVMRLENRSEQMPRMMVVRWRDVISKLRPVGSGEKERAFLTRRCSVWYQMLRVPVSAPCNCRNDTSTCAMTRVVDLAAAPRLRHGLRHAKPYIAFLSAPCVQSERQRQNNLHFGPVWPMVWKVELLTPDCSSV